MAYLKNSRGRPDFLLTASVVSLGVILAKVLAAGATVGPVTVGQAPDAATIGAILLPTLGAYTMKRLKVDHHPEEKKP